MQLRPKIQPVWMAGVKKGFPKKKDKTPSITGKEQAKHLKEQCLFSKPLGGGNRRPQGLQEILGF